MMVFHFACRERIDDYSKLRVIILYYMYEIDFKCMCIHEGLNLITLKSAGLLRMLFCADEPSMVDIQSKK